MRHVKKMFRIMSDNSMKSMHFYFFVCFLLSCAEVIVNFRTGGNLIGRSIQNLLFNDWRRGSREKGLSPNHGLSFNKIWSPGVQTVTHWCFLLSTSHIHNKTQGMGNSVIDSGFSTGVLCDLGKIFCLPEVSASSSTIWEHCNISKGLSRFSGLCFKQVI